MKINKVILKDLEEFGIPDGEYELNPGPTGREENRFRKEGGLSPSDLRDALQNGGFDAIRYVAYIVLIRAGNEIGAAGVFDIPLERLAGIEGEVVTDEEVGEEKLPPPLGLESNGSEPEDTTQQSTSSSRSSEVLA